MSILTDLEALHRTAHEKDETEAEAPATPEQLLTLEKLAGGALPADVAALLASPAAHGPGGFGDIEVEADDYEGALPFEGFFGITAILADNENLAKAREDYSQFADVPPCVVFSLVNNQFLACQLEDSQMIHIDGDDGEVSDLGLDFGVFLERYADALRAATG